MSRRGDTTVLTQPRLLVYRAAAVVVQALLAEAG